jgi:hypothetical protein
LPNNEVYTRGRLEEVCISIKLSLAHRGDMTNHVLTLLNNIYSCYLQKMLLS